MSQTWRGLLGELIETPSERERLANQSWEFTLGRLGAGSRIRPDHAPVPQEIPDLFPKQKAALLQLLRVDYPGLFPERAEEPEREPQVQDPFHLLLTTASALSADPVLAVRLSTTLASFNSHPNWSHQQKQASTS